MKMKDTFAAAILTAVLCISGNLLAYSGGNGTVIRPYQIANVDDFLQLSTTPTDWNLSFILTANIKLSSLTFTQSPIAPDTDNAASGFQGTKFTGVFDGNGCVLGSLTINAPAKDHIGLFGCTNNATIRNLRVGNVDITGQNWVGGLVGLVSDNTGSLAACGVTGSVSGVNYVGGLVGFNSACPFTTCYATSSVTGAGSYVGGLIGENFSGSMTDCYATGSVSVAGYDAGGLVGLNRGLLTSCYATGLVSGSFYVGGLVGYNDAAAITNCHATGTIEGTGDTVGGLVGCNDQGSIIRCYAAGSVSGINDVGGLTGMNESGMLTGCYAAGSVSGAVNVGGLTGENYSDSTVTFCYATGSVSGTSYVGGLVGENYTSGSVTACYAAGPVSGTTSNVGGLTGGNYSSSHAACFWDTQTSGQIVGVGYGDTEGAFGKTTAEMKTLSTFTAEGWDFINVWAIGEHQTYPYLQTRPSADLNYDGAVNLLDFALFAEHWLQGAGA